jgi:hypothetical protein
MKNIILVAVALGLAATLSACGSTGIQNEGLLKQPLTGGQSRVKIVRSEQFLASGRGARVKIDGKEVADIGNGAGAILDVPAGPHNVSVDVWDHPNVFNLRIEAKPGRMYTLLIKPREDAVMAGAVLGVAGMLVEAAANENGGLFQVEVVDEQRIG